MSSCKLVFEKHEEPEPPGTPMLERNGGVHNAPAGTPPHVVIAGENLHALQLLQKDYTGLVDAIYIDPPYNSGAATWRYNNRYHERGDTDKHSRWLSFMQRRLELAKPLLNPENSVLIVTIDEKEYLRLGLLLEQTFPEARIQMVSSVINPSAVARANELRRSDEYIYLVMFGDIAPAAMELGPEWGSGESVQSKLRWNGLMRSGTNARRVDRPRMFYPIFIERKEDGPVIHSLGDPFDGDIRGYAGTPNGCVAVWPIRSDGSEGNWQVSKESLLGLMDQGYVKLGNWRLGRTSISYLKRGEQQKIEDGVFPVTGHAADGSVVVDESSYIPQFVPGTQWRIPSHNAGGAGGSTLLRGMMPDRRFPFPKSLYAVEDALRFFVSDKPDALILDFFAGSGTTAHAVMRLNAEDGGRRRSISISNNEVGPDEAKALREAGHMPGDPDWEALGICDHITKPRLRAAITGVTPAGEPIKGRYSYNREADMADGMEATVEFYNLRYEDVVVSPDLAK